MTIVIVRHGETAGNAGLVLQKAEIPLNERGQTQAQALAARLVTLGCVHLLCSDMPRALMTAQPLAARTGLPIEQSALLQERNFGDLRGTPYSELTENPFAPGFAPPNGEDWATFHERVARAFALILARRRALAGPLLVVTHGLVCHALATRHLSPGSFVVPARFDNTSVSIFAAEPPHTASLLNCTEHLPVAAGEGGAA
jgi:broad specificity phosphatase PhoE